MWVDYNPVDGEMMRIHGFVFELPSEMNKLWQQVVVWVNYEPTEVEIDDDNTRICI